MSKVLIGQEILQKAIRRFERKPGAEIVFFDRIAGNPKLHFSIAASDQMRPKAYSRTEEIGSDGKIYKIFLPDTIAIARFED